MFCSAACQNKWQGRNKTSNICKVCGNLFKCSPSRNKWDAVLYCSIACRDASPQSIENLRQMNLGQQSGKRTRCEVAGYAILDSLKIDYRPQHLLAGKFCVDAFIESLATVVQFDGDYWHGNPAKFPEPDSRQAKRMRLDKSQDAYLKRCGYRVLRFWESDLLKNPSEVASAIRPLLSGAE